MLPRKLTDWLNEKHLDCRLVWILFQNCFVSELLNLLQYILMNCWSCTKMNQ